MHVGTLITLSILALKITYAAQSPKYSTHRLAHCEISRAYTPARVCACELTQTDLLRQKLGIAHSE